LALVAGRDRMLDAMGDVVGEDLLLGAPQRGAHRRKLGHDVDAIAVLLDHAREAAHLALDPPEPLEHRGLGRGTHGRYIPLPGIRFKLSRMEQAAHAHGAEAATARDPVCGMRVGPKKPAPRRNHRGRDYFFCSDGCRSKFAADPEKYLAAGKPASEAKAPPGAIYTCPMHPQIRQV